MLRIPVTGRHSCELHRRPRIEKGLTLGSGPVHLSPKVTRLCIAFSHTSARTSSTPKSQLHMSSWKPGLRRSASRQALMACAENSRVCKVVWRSSWRMFPYKSGLVDALSARDGGPNQLMYGRQQGERRGETYPPPLVFTRSITNGFLLHPTAPASDVMGNKMSGWAIRKFSGDWYENVSSRTASDARVGRESLGFWDELQASRLLVISGDMIFTTSPNRRYCGKASSAKNPYPIQLCGHIHSPVARTRSAHSPIRVHRIFLVALPAGCGGELSTADAMESTTRHSKIFVVC